ncbi:unnamed protein product [Bemisia tabaci]|uniref:RING-type E3 ubiquitin transferase n=1 Tax=Bemisia tabaci TaxID=7038 RepID=A0A9P0AD05_BEMTA|nr:unnamed protein product [Bemisia tabaci]
MASTEPVGLSKSWELSMYELHRTPQEAITDNTEIAVSPRSLHSELMCPICLDMLKKTMTTKECLHRFCSDCIITALRSGNKECPTCRKKLVSKRSLRPDPNFDLLISKIYPSRDEYEAHQVRVLEKLNKSHSQAALVNSITEGIKLQTQNRLQRLKKNANDPDTTQNEPQVPPSLQNESAGERLSSSFSVVNENSQSSCSSQLSKDNVSAFNSKFLRNSKSMTNSEIDSTESSMDTFGGNDSMMEGETSTEVAIVNEIELVFKPHPLEMVEDDVLIKALRGNSIRYIKTTANATVDHLSKYLAMRLTLDLGAELPDRTLNFCIYISPTPNNFIILSGNQTLRQVNDKFWKVNKPLEMYYSWKKT